MYLVDVIGEAMKICNEMQYQVYIKSIYWQEEEYGVST